MDLVVAGLATWLIVKSGLRDKIEGRAAYIILGDGAKPLISTAAIAAADAKPCRTVIVLTASVA